MLLCGSEEVDVCWACRSANGAAHRLGKEGYDNELFKTWLHVPPACIANTGLGYGQE